MIQGCVVLYYYIHYTYCVWCHRDEVDILLAGQGRESCRVAFSTPERERSQIIQKNLNIALQRYNGGTVIEILLEVSKRNASTYFRTFSTDISEFSRWRKRFMVGLGEDLTGISESKQIREQYEASSFKSQQSGRSEGRTDFDPELSLRSFRKQEEERIRVQRMDLLLFFVLGVAVSAPFTAILSSLSYFSTTLYGNPKVFLYLNIAVYCPTIVVSTLQGMCDLHYNSRYGHLLAYNFRIVTTFLISAAVLVVAPTRLEYR